MHSTCVACGSDQWGTEPSGCSFIHTFTFTLTFTVVVFAQCVRHTVFPHLLCLSGVRLAFTVLQERVCSA